MVALMAAPSDVRKRLDELIARCEEWAPRTAERQKVSHLKVDLWRFMVSSLQTVASACGAQSPHSRELERCREMLVYSNDLDIDTCRGVLEAARDDLAAGMLSELRQLVVAEAFGDLLESAVHLRDEGHHIAAVAVAGAVLESSLRNLAAARSVVWSGSSGIAKLNQALYAARVYDKVVFGEIEAWGKLRNQADHGEFTRSEEVDAGSVARMVDGVRGFVLRFR